MKKARHLRKLLLLHLPAAVLVCCYLTSAQTQSDDSIVLNVLVTSEKGRVALGLKREDFSVSINKRPQNVLSITGREMPASVGIVIDRSSSLDQYGKKAEAVFKKRLGQGLERFMTQSHASNEYFVLTFADTVSMVQDWASDPGAVTGKLNAIKYEGNTSLYDALNDAIRKVATGRHAKQVVIVFSDGADNRSKTTFYEVRELLKRSNVILYAFGVQDRKTAASSLGTENEGVLDELTGYVGGRAFFTHLDSDAKAFHQIFELMAIELRSQYQIVVSQETPAAKEKWHKFNLTATRANAAGKPEKLKVRTREGYYR